jgi:hypothetical protein
MARERLHLYTWRLEQMLPREPNARFTIPPR